jgi:hypothetical protein
MRQGLATTFSDVCNNDPENTVSSQVWMSTSYKSAARTILARDTSGSGFHIVEQTVHKQLWCWDNVMDVDLILSMDDTSTRQVESEKSFKLKVVTRTTPISGIITVLWATASVLWQDPKGTGRT